VSGGIVEVVGSAGQTIGRGGAGRAAICTGQTCAGSPTAGGVRTGRTKVDALIVVQVVAAADVVLAIRTNQHKVGNASCTIVITATDATTATAITSNTNRTTIIEITNIA